MLGVALVSLIVKVPLELPEPRVTIGDEALKASGEAPDKVTVLLAAMVVAPEMAPVLEIPPLLLFIPPVIDAPPALTVNPPDVMVCPKAKVLA